MGTHIPSQWVWRLIEALVIFTAAALTVRIGRRFLQRWAGLRAKGLGAGAQARRTTLYQLLTSALRYVIDFIALLTVLDIFGVPTTSLLAGAGILGLAIGFGAQGVVQDIVTGLFILYENQYAVGDHIALPSLGLSGTVFELGLRITRLSGANGEEIIIPNRLVLEVQNHTRRDTSATVSIPVSVDADPREVKKLLEQLIREAQHQIPGIELSGITAIQQGAVIWSISAPTTYTDAALIGNRMREVVARLIYDAQLPLAGSAKGAGWTSPGIK